MKYQSEWRWKTTFLKTNFNGAIKKIISENNSRPGSILILLVTDQNLIFGTTYGTLSSCWEPGVSSEYVAQVRKRKKRGKTPKHKNQQQLKSGTKDSRGVILLILHVANQIPSAAPHIGPAPPGVAYEHRERNSSRVPWVWTKNTLPPPLASRKQFKKSLSKNIQSLKKENLGPEREYS